MNVMNCAQATRDLIDVLPTSLREWFIKNLNRDDLIEIVLDLGREPEIRYFNESIYKDGYHITERDIKSIEQSRLLGSFSNNNRAGLPNSLHRISRLVDRDYTAIGFTMRIGRQIPGCADMLADILESGESVLLIGKPGVGKTSKLREIARILSQTKRVVIIDKSNEIAGDAQIPHESVGKARRMMVPFDKTQADVMIEAVENHTPDVIIIDEMSTINDAKAAITIAERGVQLIGTVHGDTLGNLIVNFPMNLLLGKISDHTVGDKAANKQDGRKNKIERIMPPVFQKLIELIDYDTCAVHHDLTQAVDLTLTGHEVHPEIRQTKNGKIEIQAAQIVSPQSSQPKEPDEDLEPEIEVKVARFIAERKKPEQHRYKPRKRRR